MFDALSLSTEKNVRFPEIGDVLFVPSATAKYIRISLKPFAGVRVTVPKRVPLRQAMDFVEQKADWIRRAQMRTAKEEHAYTIFTPETVFSTSRRRVHILPWNSVRFRTRLTKDTLTIFYPRDVDVASEKIQLQIRHYINETFRNEAKEYLPQRTEQLAGEHGFSHRGVTVKNISSRWGSCSFENRINLNIHLMRLPKHLSDYVILHELVHTVHKNHGALFWRCLDGHIGGKAKLLAKEMKQYHAGWY